MTVDMQIAQAIAALRQEFDAKVRDLTRQMQELTVRVQGYATKVQELQDEVATIIGPLPDVPALNLNTRPRF